MKNKLKTQLKTPLSIGSIILAGFTSSHAASIAWVGVDYNVDAKQTSLPMAADSVGWRNSTDVKAFGVGEVDIDGDNIYGTDGYRTRGGNTTGSISYLASAGNIASGGNNFGYMDNPSDPTGIDTFRVGFWGSSTTAASLDLFSFTVAGTDLDSQTLRLGVHFDGYSSNDGLNFTWTQTVGGSATASSGTVISANDGYDFAFFDLNGASAGDTFVLSVSDNYTTSKWLNYDGVVFDTAPIPEPSSTALLGLGGLALLLRRRR
jgi:hypothetical protein